MPSPCLSGDLEVALERQRRLVAMAPFVSDQGTRRQDERAFDDLAAQIPALLQRLGYGPSHKLSQRSADLTQLGAMVLAFARDERLHQARAMAAEFAQSMQELQAPGRGRAPAAIARGRGRAGEHRLQLAHAHRLGVRRRRGERTADRPHRPAAAAPRAVAPARRRHGARPPRPQRYLGRHPGTDASGRGGQARALGRRLQGQVDRAAAEEGRARARSISSSTRRSTTCPWGSACSMPRSASWCATGDTPRCTSCRASSTRPGTARCALWDHRERKGARHYPDRGGRRAGIGAQPTP